MLTSPTSAHLLTSTKLRPPYCLLPTTSNLLPSTYYLLPTTYYLLPTTYYLLPTTYDLVPPTYYLIPLTYHHLTPSYSTIHSPLPLHDTYYISLPYI